MTLHSLQAAFKEFIRTYLPSSLKGAAVGMMMVYVLFCMILMGLPRWSGVTNEMWHPSTSRGTWPPRSHLAFTAQPVYLRLKCYGLYSQDWWYRCPWGCFVSELMGLLTVCGLDNTPLPHEYFYPLNSTIDSWGTGGVITSSFSGDAFIQLCHTFPARADTVKYLYIKKIKKNHEKKKALCHWWWVSGFHFITQVISGVSMRTLVYLYPILNFGK